MSYHYLSVSSVDGLDTPIYKFLLNVQYKLFLKLFISSLQVKPQTKELLWIVFLSFSCCI